MNSTALAKLRASGPPYPPGGAILGGTPNGKIDVAISALFVAIFACLAATHMTIFQVNKRRAHFFIPSAVTFGFCMARITTFALRIAWSKHPTNVNLAIAANVFLSAGVILLYIINLIYSQRLLRAYHPNFGNRPAVNSAFLAYYVSVVLVLIMVLELTAKKVVICTVLTFFTLDQDRIRICRNVQRFGSVYFTVFCFLPIPLVLLSRFVPRTAGKAKFGKLGTLSHKVMIVLTASGLLTLESAFRAGVGLLPARPITNPAWYHKRAALYTFMPMLEILVVLLFAVTRVDQRFFIEGKAERMLAEDALARETEAARK
ncbi:hypothetical protein EDC01DRAFT_629523 [Geopyxis carbonaria]|nr:hypothetical protein EDC01DRAFT_629523 [Geopyxis carbonaria]